MAINISSSLVLSFNFPHPLLIPSLSWSTSSSIPFLSLLFLFFSLIYWFFCPFSPFLGRRHKKTKKKKKRSTRVDVSSKKTSVIGDMLTYRSPYIWIRFTSVFKIAPVATSLIVWSFYYFILFFFSLFYLFIFFLLKIVTFLMMASLFGRVSNTHTG